MQTTPNTSALTATLNLNGVAKVGDMVTVTVTPNDGHIDGMAATATTTIASPSAGTVALLPTNPGATDTITATLTGANAHSFSYQWQVNNIVVQTTANTSSLTDALNLAGVANVMSGDTVTVQVTPSDGTNNGSVASNSVSVA